MNSYRYMIIIATILICITGVIFIFIVRENNKSDILNEEVNKYLLAINSTTLSEEINLVNHNNITNIEHDIKEVIINSDAKDYHTIYDDYEVVHINGVEYLAKWREKNPNNSYENDISKIIEFMESTVITGYKYKGDTYVVILMSKNDVITPDYLSNVKECYDLAPSIIGTEYSDDDIEFYYVINPDSEEFAAILNDELFWCPTRNRTSIEVGARRYEAKASGYPLDIIEDMYEEYLK